MGEISVCPDTILTYSRALRARVARAEVRDCIGLLLNEGNLFWS